MPEPLSPEEVRHVARLARLHLSEQQLATYREQLSSILEHLARLNEIDVEGVEPLAHPHDATNRLAEDEVAEPLPVEAVLAIAPAVEDRYLAVPKVLEGA